MSLVKLRKSFTLIELTTTVIILGILALIGSAVYLRTMERARMKEAVSNIKLIQAAEHIKYLEFYQFYDCSTPSAVASSNCKYVLDIAESVPTENWTYGVTVDASGFTATATRTGGFWSSCGYTLTDTVNSRNSPQQTGTCAP